MSQQFTSDRPSWDEIRAARKPRTDTAWVPLNGELLEQIANLEKAVVAAEKVDAREHRTPQAPRLSEQLDTLRIQAEDAAVAFTFTEIPRRQFRAIVEACPPTNPAWKWDEERFAPLLLAATCVDPVLVTEDREAFLARLNPGVKYETLADLIGPAEELWDEWSEAACYLLYGTAHAVNAQGATIPFSVTASARTRDLLSSSTSASETDEASDMTSS